MLCILQHYVLLRILGARASRRNIYNPVLMDSYMPHSDVMSCR